MTDVPEAREPTPPEGSKQAAKPPPAPNPKDLLLPWALAGALAAVTIAVWVGTVRVPFHFDDQQTVQFNAPLRKLESGRKWTRARIFLRRGATRLTDMVVYAFSKKKDDGEPQPDLFHKVNLAIHAVNVILIFWLIWIVLRDHDLREPRRSISAGLVSLLFAVTPMHAMAVCLIGSKAELQAVMFMLLTILLALLAAEPGRNREIRMGLAAAAAISMMLALGTKSIGLISLPLFGLLMYYRLGGLRKIPPRVQLLGAVGMAVLFGLGVLMLSMSNQLWLPGQPGNQMNLLSRPGVVVRYLTLIVFPHHMSNDPEIPLVTPSVHLIDFILPFLAVLALGAAGLLLAARRHLLGLCILWFFLCVGPVTSIVARPSRDLMFEYKVYLALVGVMAGLVMGLWWLTDKVEHRLSRRGADDGSPRPGGDEQDDPLPRRPAGRLSAGLAVGVCVVAALAFSIFSRQRVRIFQSELALWKDAALKSPNKPRPHSNYGACLQKEAQKRQARARGLLVQAQRLTTEATHKKRRLATESAALDKAQADALRAEVRQAETKAAGLRERAKEARDEAMQFSETAIKEFRLALDFKPNYHAAHNNLAAALQETAHKHPGRSEEAMWHFRYAINIHVNYVDARFNLGSILLQRKRYKEAAAQFRKIIEITQLNVMAYQKLAMCYKEMGDYENASKYFNLYTSKVTGRLGIQGRGLLGASKSLEGKHEEALQHLLQALKKARRQKKETFKLHHNLASVYRSLKRSAEATRHYERAIELGSRMPQTYNSLAHMYKMQMERLAADRQPRGGSPADRDKIENLHKAAMKNFRKSIEAGAKRIGLVDPYFNLGALLWQQRKYDEAVARFQEVLAINPKHTDALNNIGVYHGQRRELKKALSFFRRALSADPRSAKAHFNVGRTHEHLGQPDEARKHYRQATALDPDYPEPHYHIGNMLWQERKFDEAVKRFLKVVKISPKQGSSVHADALNFLGVYHMQSRDFGPALKWFKRAVTANPRSAKALYNAGVSYQQLGQREQAIQHLKQALQVKPNFQKARKALDQIQK